jgi:hypothetical protein
VTHLLVDETNGAKYEHADRFRVRFVINSRWFFESIERGKRLPEENYLMPRPSELEAGEKETKVQHHTGGGDDILAQDSNDAGLRGNFIEDDDEEDSLFLAGCVIFLSSQFKKEKLSRAVRMIRAGGGTRLPEYSHQITHFVVPFTSNSSSTCHPPLSDSDIRTLQKLNKTPYVVGEKWLFSSHAARKQLPPDEFLIPLPFTISAESQSSSNQTSSAFVIPPGITSSAVNNSQAGMLRTSFCSSSLLLSALFSSR